MGRRRWAGVGLGAAALAGAVVGAVAFAPALGLAQTEGEPDPDATEVVVDGWCFGDGEGPVAVAAEAIGIPPGDLLYAMRDGSSIAEVARSEGVEVDAVVDALVGSMQERLDAAVQDGFYSQEVADELAAGFEDRAREIVNGGFPFLLPGGSFRGPLHGGPFLDGPLGGSSEGPWAETETRASDAGLL